MSDFASVLLAWYKKNARDLPWRLTTDPYRIWISEIILQQTRVAQGYDYYTRFVKRFPDIISLADADEDEVLHYWQGLGYYSRARNLHTAAISMNGCFPNTYKGVLALKGVGPYTAAAICSIAFDMPVAVVDGNVYRLLARYLGMDVPIDTSAGKILFAKTAQSLLDSDHPGQYNQAIMDFGALQCVPATPNCPICPFSADCAAFSQGSVHQLPVKQHHTQTTNRYFHYIYVRMGDSLWIHKRTGNDIWKNLYELPLIETSEATEPEKILSLPTFQQLVCSAKEPVFSCLNSVKHVLTHRIIHAVFYRLDLPEDTIVPSGYIQIKTDDWEKYAMPQLVYRFMKKNT